MFYPAVYLSLHGMNQRPGMLSAGKQVCQMRFVSMAFTFMMEKQNQSPKKNNLGLIV